MHNRISRSGWVSVAIPEGWKGKPVAVYNSANEAMPSQVISDSASVAGKVLFKATVPSVGYNTYTLTWGLLLIGAGIGLFFAYMLDYFVFVRSTDDNPAIYFALIDIFGGAGLFLSYHIEKKDAIKREEIER